ncbi:hypothetical protein AeNC1_010960 [Aphanomyces euteiches]|nr:hypothetical protein AeNC1_010960 [Aphanomyces euteiches]
MHSLLASALLVFAALGRVDSQTWFEISVVGDATYKIQGPICSGNGILPAGIKCPQQGDTAVADCHAYLPSFANGNCVAPTNASCQKIPSGAWGCVWVPPNVTDTITKAPCFETDAPSTTPASTDALVTDSPPATQAPTTAAPSPTGATTTAPNTTAPATTQTPTPTDALVTDTPDVSQPNDTPSSTPTVTTAAPTTQPATTAAPADTPAPTTAPAP